LQHIADLFSTAAIPRGNGPVQPFPVRLSPITDIPVLLHDGTRSSPGAVMSATHTDEWMVVHRGVVLAEEYLQGMTPDTRHLLMSVSKSLIATVVGALAADGTLELDRPVSDYVPELAKSGYSGAHIRHLLDMRSGIAFSEDYLDPAAEVRLLEQAIGWAPRRNPGVPGTMYDFLLTLTNRRTAARSCTAVARAMCSAGCARQQPDPDARAPV